ncbi:MAG TPA: autotransporter-associated beta strand repeat-containing protein [Lacipirellulaceae bacterium]|nr:autotransporter-associated beta strand repeat-containing protein [Lacipirellulaceae bacterium]
MYFPEHLSIVSLPPFEFCIDPAFALRFAGGHPTQRRRAAPSRFLACAFVGMTIWFALPGAVPAYDLHFDYTSFDHPNTPGTTPHFGQAQFDVLNYASINGNYMNTSTDTHRPEMVAHGNALAEFYNNFSADYANFPGRTAIAEADAINTYTTNNSTRNGPRPDWLVLNEIRSSDWNSSPTYRQWVIDVTTRLHDLYGYDVVTYSPFETAPSGAAGTSMQTLSQKSYIAIEAYLTGKDVWNSGSTYASRVTWAQNQYQASKNSYTSQSVAADKLFVSEDFSNTPDILNGVHVAYGRAGITAAQWDSVIQIRQDAIYNVGFNGFLAYAWGGNDMGITEDEQIEHEYYYRSRLVLPTQKPQWLSDDAIDVNGTMIPLSWNQPLNWIGGVPNASGAEANFWRTLSANRTITLDGSKTVGTLTFDSPFSYTINPGSGGSLIFNNGGSSATLTSSQGIHTINTAVQLTSNLNAAINAGTFTVSGAIGGSGSITKSGAGALTLTSTHSYTGATIVQSGTLSFNSSGLADAADVFLSSGATLQLNFNGSPDVIDSLFLNGTSMPVGTWGAIGSGAQFTSSLLGGSGMLQVSTYVPSFLAGDYNSNGVVDAADYVVWRKSIGADSIPNRDSQNTGPVGQADFDVWRADLGRIVGAVAGSGSGLSVATTAVPEPATGGLVIAVLLQILFPRRDMAVALTRRCSP